RWENFDELVNNILLIIQQSDGGDLDIRVSVDPPPASAPATCDHAGTALSVNGGITVIRYDGGPGLTLSAAAAAEVPVPTEAHALIATSADGYISLYRLTTGEWQTNISPYSDGLTYTCVWTGIASAEGIHT